MSAVRIEELDPSSYARINEDLARILTDAVASGASVGFLPPFDERQAAAWWSSLAPDVAAGRLIVLVARDRDAMVGTAQLRLAQLPNATHRAEVAKVLVHSGARRMGVGRMLMAAIEDVARAHGRTLLVLDTLTGSEGEPFYAALGWTRAAVIPGYARVPGGELRATTVFYKLL